MILFFIFALVDGAKLVIFLRFPCITGRKIKQLPTQAGKRMQDVSNGRFRPFDLVTNLSELVFPFERDGCSLHFGIVQLGEGKAYGVPCSA